MPPPGDAPEVTGSLLQDALRLLEQWSDSAAQPVSWPPRIVETSPFPGRRPVGSETAAGLWRVLRFCLMTEPAGAALELVVGREVAAGTGA